MFLPLPYNYFSIIPGFCQVVTQEPKAKETRGGVELVELDYMV